MEEKKQRSYAKESTKSKPSGVRFDLEKVEFVKTKEKLNTYQKVVDFLLNKYWWEFKIAKPSHKGLPPNEMEGSFEDIQPENTSAWNTPIKSLKPQIKRTPAHWVELRRECEDAEQYAQWLEDLENDQFLTTREKAQIKQTV